MYTLLLAPWCLLYHQLTDSAPPPIAHSSNPLLKSADVAPELIRQQPCLPLVLFEHCILKISAETSLRWFQNFLVSSHSSPNLVANYSVFLPPSGRNENATSSSLAPNHDPKAIGDTMTSIIFIRLRTPAGLSWNFWQGIHRFEPGSGR